MFVPHTRVSCHSFDSFEIGGERKSDRMDDRLGSMVNPPITVAMAEIQPGREARAIQVSGIEEVSTNPSILEEPQPGCSPSSVRWFRLRQSRVGDLDLFHQDGGLMVPRSFGFMEGGRDAGEEGASVVAS
jgi:hypothetical protein